jgi:hypothetical protein
MNYPPSEISCRKAIPVFRRRQADLAQGKQERDEARTVEEVKEGKVKIRSLEVEG